MPDSAFSDLALTGLMSVLALAAVWIPLQRGLAKCWRAWKATRRLSPAELRAALTSGAADPSLAVLMARVLGRSLRESGGSHPREFLVDATRQYVANEYETHYARIVSMYANLLPPIGFIGTTAGLLILFLSLHLSNAALELSALALALLSSIFALIGFACLEGLKIRLYGRLLACLDDVLALERAFEGRSASPAARRAPA